MRDEKSIHLRLEQLRGQLLQSGTTDLRVFVIRKDELPGWIQALESILGKTGAGKSSWYGCSPAGQGRADFRTRI